MNYYVICETTKTPRGLCKVKILNKSFYNYTSEADALLALCTLHNKKKAYYKLRGVNVGGVFQYSTSDIEYNKFTVYRLTPNGEYTPYKEYAIDVIKD